MKLSIIAVLTTAIFGLAACQPATQNQVVGGLIGAGAGLVGAEIFDANPQWTAIAVLAGAAAGTLIAQNQATRECAYADGYGGYYIAPC